MPPHASYHAVVRSAFASALDEQSLNTHKLDTMTHANGLIMLRRPVTIIWKQADRGAQPSGLVRPEQSNCTNPIGTAIVEQAPAMIHAGSAESNIHPIPLQTDANPVKLSANDNPAMPTGNRA